jgi:hypothetical protein
LLQGGPLAAEAQAKPEPDEQGGGMKRLNWKVFLGLSLLLLSALVYFLHYLIFRDVHHILLYLVGDTAFVFIEILFVTLIIDGLLQSREKKARLKKLFMVIGVFFSEVGARLLVILSDCDPGLGELQKGWSSGVLKDEQKFMKIQNCLKTHDFGIQAKKVEWEGLKEFLAGKRDFLLRLLENPNLLEHETFTDVLWAVFHLTEELSVRESLQGLPESDFNHLTVDIKRIYGRLALQWLDYMAHLKASYPYLFSLALRMNPFDRSASPVIRE